MRRRLTLSMILMVAVALVLAGGVLVAVETHAARARTQDELLRDARGLAVTVKAENRVASPHRALSAGTDPASRLRAVLRALKGPLRLQGETVLALSSKAKLFDPATPLKAVHLPGRLDESHLDPRSLLAGRSVSGVQGSLVYAAVPYPVELRLSGVSTPITAVALLTRRSPIGVGHGWPWLGAAFFGIIAVAALLALRLSRRIVAPLAAAEAVTGRIAAGDLTARVPEPAAKDAELTSLVDSVNVMAESLSHARDAERELLVSVSHELRTPLTSIRGYAEAIEDGAAPDSRWAASVILAESGRLSRLIDDLLELAKLRSTAFGLRLASVDVGAIAAATAQGFAPAAERGGVTLTYAADPSGADPPGSPVLATADGDRLAQVVANLVENAIGYARGRVHLGTGQHAGQPLLWVDDDGPGIGAAELPRVFDRMFTTSDRDGRQVGSGLGLAIVAQLVGAMGGAVEARSPVSDTGGTRMVVTLRPADNPAGDGP